MSKRAAEIERRKRLAATVEAREQIIRPRKRGGDDLLVLTNTSTTCKTATQDRRTELVKPGGQAIVSERELDGLRARGGGEHDRAFQKTEKFDPNNPQHRDLMRRHKGG